MHIYLFDEETKKDIQLDLNVEYSIPCSNLIVVFYSKGQVCGLKKGDSSPYDEYYFKQIHHIVGAKLAYQGHNYSFKFGYYSGDIDLIPFLMSQTGTNPNIRFANSSINDENYFSDFKVIDFNEY